MAPVVSTKQSKDTIDPVALPLSIYHQTIKCLDSQSYYVTTQYYQTINLEFWLLHPLARRHLEASHSALFSLISYLSWCIILTA